MHERKWQSVSLLPPLVLFLFQLGPRLQVVDIHILMVLALGLLAIAMIGMRRAFPDWLGYAMLGLLPAFIYAAAASGLSGFRDLALPWLIVKLYLYLLATYSAVELYRRYYADGWRDRIIRHTMNIWLVNAIFVLAFVLIGPFRRTVGRYWDVAGKEHWVEDGYRGLDISLGGGVNAGVAFVLVCFMLLLFRRRIEFSAERFMAYLLLLLLAAILSARTSLVLLVLGGGVLAGEWVVRKLILPSLEVRAAAWRAGGVVLLTLAVLAWAIVQGLVPDQMLRWAFEFMFSDGSGVAATRSTERIFSEMYFTPPDTFTTLFGNGSLGRSAAAEYLASDVGYVRVLFAVGLVGSLLVWLPFVAAWVYRMRASAQTDFLMMFSLLVLFMFVVNIKELMLAERGLGVLAVAIWALVSDHRAMGEGEYARS